MEDRIITYGGQAVMEGVMMRGQKAFAVAMRAPDGSIITHTEKLAKIYTSKITKIPFLRGVILLWDALGLGMKALTLSANVQTGEDEKLEGASLYLTVGLSLLMGIGLFFLLPTSVGGGVEYLLAKNGISSYWIGNLVEGVFQLILLITYMWAIGFMPDVKRVFQYHGAEHKTINAFEAGADLTPENVAKYPIEHPRCGTAFLLTLMLFSILLFSLLGPMPNILLRIASRIIFIPVLAGISLEYIRWTANNLNNPFVKLLIKPNLALQHLTTRDPDLSMLEVAIESFQSMRKAEAEAEIVT